MKESNKARKAQASSQQYRLAKHPVTIPSLSSNAQAVTTGSSQEPMDVDMRSPETATASDVSTATSGTTVVD